MIVPLDDTIECCVYTGKATPDAVETLLSRRFSSAPRDDFIEVGSHLIEVRRSEEKWAEEEQVVFMQWPVYVELYGDPDDPSGVTDLTATVLRTLWEHGYPAVAACDFEHELPWSGGIQSPVMPPEHF